MPLKKGFLKERVLINRYTLAIGITIGAFFSLGLYGIFYFVREAIRIFPVLRSVDYLFELTPYENFIYNLFYGSVAVILGVNIIISFVFRNAISHQSRKVNRKISYVLNDAGLFLWITLMVISRVFISIGIWYFSDFYFAFQNHINFLREFPLLFLLLPLMLLLNNYNFLLRIFGRGGHKWGLYMFIYVMVLSGFFAFYNFYDYKGANDYFKSRNPITKYDINTPTSKTSDLLYKLRFITDVYVTKKDLATGEYKILWDSVEKDISVDEIVAATLIDKEQIDWYEWRRYGINLIADKSCELSFIKQIKAELMKAGVERIFYSTSPVGSIYPDNSPLFKNSGMGFRLINTYSSEMEEFLDKAEKLIEDSVKFIVKMPASSFGNRLMYLKEYNRVEIKVDNEQVYLNNEIISDTDLENFIYRFIRKYKGNYAIIYSPDENISYGRYIKYLDLFDHQVILARAEMKGSLPQEEENTGEFDKQKRMIREVFPKIYVEWSEQEKRLMRLLESNRKYNK